MDRVLRLWAIGGGALLLAIVAVTMVNVSAFIVDFVTRLWGIRIPGLSGYEDFVRLTVGPAVLMLFPYCQHHSGHITADIFTRGFSPSKRNWLNGFWRIITVCVTVLLGAFMVQGMLEARADNALSPILGWREWLFYPPAIISVFLWAAAASLKPHEQ